MFARMFKFFKTDKTKDEQISDPTLRMKFIELQVAKEIKKLTNLMEFDIEDVIGLEVENSEIFEFYKSLLDLNSFISYKNGKYSIELGKEIKQDDSNLTIASLDLINYIPVILKGKINANYDKKHVAIVWNTFFDDLYFKNLRKELVDNISQFLHSGQTYHILDLGTGNGDIFIPFLELAEKNKITLELDLVDKVPLFINFLNRKITQSISQRINAMKSAGVGFNYAYHNYDFLDELWDLPKFTEKVNFIVMSFCTYHLSDEQIKTLGKNIREHLADDGVFFILEPSKEYLNPIISMLAFGKKIYSVEDPFIRIQNLLSDTFRTINRNVNIIEIS